MPLLIAEKPGSVVEVQTDVNVPGALVVYPDKSGGEQEAGSDALTFSEHLVILTGMSYKQQTSQQILHTIGQRIYLYVFGDRISALLINGLCVANRCDDGDTAADRAHGVEKLLAWWNKYKLSVHKKPIIVMIGNTALRAYAADLTVEMVDPAMNIWRFTLEMFAAPEESTS